MKFPELIDIIGEKAATQLAMFCGGSRVYIPHVPRTNLHDQVRESWKTGFDVKALAQTYGISPSTVYSILRPSKN